MGAALVGAPGTQRYELLCRSGHPVMLACRDAVFEQHGDILERAPKLARYGCRSCPIPETGLTRNVASSIAPTIAPVSFMFASVSGNGPVLYLNFGRRPARARASMFISGVVSRH